MSQRYPRPHDLGGEPAGPIDRDDHPVTFWEQRVDALINLMFDPKRRLFGDAAELRRGIESLGPEAYDRLGYYERWAASAAQALVEKGVLTRDEIERRVAEVAARFGRKAT